MNSTGEKAHGQFGGGSCKYGRFSGWASIFLLLFLLLPETVFGADIIVDNSDGSPAFTFQGSWSSSTSGLPYLGSHHVYNDNEDNRRASFTPNLTEAGDYDVYVRWVDDAGRDPAAQYRVYYDGGGNTTNRYVDQTDPIPAGGWLWIGNYYFRGNDPDERVRLRTNDRYGGFSVSADAVRFVGGSSPTTTTTLPPALDCMILIDNDDLITEYQGENNTRGFFFNNDDSGDWVSRTNAEAYNGSHYESRTEDARVYWSPMLPRSGDWEVFVRYADSSGYDNNAEYRVEARGNRTTVEVDQRSGGGTWVSLGTYNFNNGDSQNNNVRLTQTSGSDEVSADAVLFVEDGCTVTTTTTTTTTTTSTTTTTTSTTTTTLPPRSGTYPFVQQITPLTPSPTSDTTITFQVTFNENVVNFDASDLIITETGSLSHTGVTITPVSARVYDVDLTGCSGTGEVTLAVNTWVQNWTENATSGTAGFDEHNSFILSTVLTGNYVLTIGPLTNQVIETRTNNGFTTPAQSRTTWTDFPVDQTYSGTYPMAGGFAHYLSSTGWSDRSTGLSDWQVGDTITFDIVTGSDVRDLFGGRLVFGVTSAPVLRVLPVSTTTTTTTTTLPPPPSDCDIIIDNSDLITESQGENNTRGFYFDGDDSWEWTLLTDGDAYSGNHYESNRENARVYWIPMLPRSGSWEVFVRYADNSGYDNNAEYRVEARGNRSTVTVNQRSSGGQWVSLGSYNFNSGDSQNNNVRLTQETRNEEVSADAVRFVEPGCSATTTTTVPSGPTTTTTTTTTTLPACTYVVDNAAGSPSFTTTGSWSTNSHAQAYNGTHSRSNERDAYAYFWPPSMPAGDYRVSIWYVADNNMYDNNSLRVYYDGGNQDDYNLDQRSGGGQWQYLANYYFRGGSDPDERIRLRSRSDFRDASADAVMFERVGGCPGPTTTTTTTTSTTTTTVAGASTTTTTTTTVPWTPGACGSQPLADMPLDAMMQPAPAILMFVLDDSGSMDWEYITPESDGTFMNEYYVFNNPGDNLYGDSNILTGSNRDFWRARWSGYNYMYYNPRETYKPWPVIPGVTGIESPANPDTPRSHPRISTRTFNLSTSYDAIAGVNIARSHYFDYDDANGNEIRDPGEQVYLANIVSSTSRIDYYRVTEDGSGRITGLTLVPPGLGLLPAGYPTDYAEVRQNFANWYSFYRRRELTATAAVSNVIVGLEGVQVGIRSINGRIVQPVMQIKVGGTDQTADLLNVLYGMVLQANGTPLRRGLQYAGQYLHQNDGQNGGGLGNSPYASAENGGSCQQAFTIVMTDGYYNGSSPNVGNVDGNNGAPYADNWQNTLSDVAMVYYENDLSSSLDGVVPTTELDRNSQQHMVTYGVSFGVLGSLDPNAYDVVDGPFPNWPDPQAANANRIDDLWHASVNGRGIFLSARNPIELVQSLRAVMQNIASREGSAASVSINGDELNEEVSGEIRMYQTIYRSDGWRGDIKSFFINTTTGAPDTDNPVWSASVQLTELIGEDGSDHTDRVIATYDAEDFYSTPSGVGMPFRWADGAISYMSGTTTQWTLLDPVSSTAEDILNHVRGDRSNEIQNGGSLRNRFVGEGDSVLGDLIHSRPVYYEDRITTGEDHCIGDGSGVDSLACLLFVGGNDGMLHAFNAVTGDEKFAYVPGLVFENISSLTEPNYVHRYFVDNTPYIKKFGESSMSVLVAGLGKGGRGYFALNVKDPEEIVTEAELSSRVLWEYPEPGTTDPDMGYSFSETIIVKTNDSRINNGTAYEGYVVLFGNGYSCPDGQAVLYLLDPLTGGKLLSSDAGVRKIYGGVSTSCNGLSTPAAVDVNNDTIVDYVYAGDLLGNMWKFDLTSSDHTQWSVAYADSSGTPMPLFTATADRSSGSSGVQAITTRPDVMYQCGAEDGYMVIFGTGKYLENSDVNDTTVESIYAVWDYGDDADNSEFLGRFDTGSSPSLSNQLANVGLLEQTAIFDGQVDIDGDGDLDDHYRVLSNNQIKLWTVDDATAGQQPNPGVGGRDSDLVDNDNDGEIDEADEQVAHAGWHFDLPIEKERVITNLFIRDNKVIVISFTPTEGSCSGRGGFSIIHEMDACSGGRLGTWVAATDLVYDLNGDGVINVSDYDLNGDGVIDQDEFYIDMNGDGKHDANDLNALDKNGDGVVDTNEFMTLDTNGDGTINEHDEVFIEEPAIDINGDNAVNRDDYIVVNVYDPDSGTDVPLSVPVSGLRREGMLHPPPILRMGDVEKKYMSSSTGLIEIITEPAERRGMNYWKKVK